MSVLNQQGHRGHPKPPNRSSLCRFGVRLMQGCCRATGNESGSGDLMANRDRAQLGPSVDGQSREQPDGAREGKVYSLLRP